MKSLSFVATAVAAMLSLSVPAAETAPENAIVVTATRTAQTVDESLAAVTVITREDIERSQVQSVPELLTGLAGVDFNVTGGYGKTTGLFLRGTNAAHAVVLIDGLRVGSATSGESAWEHLAPAQIERIEVVRGPRSSLYGADAVGGVIQIFTRRGTDQIRGGISAGYGTHNTRDYAAHVSGASDGMRFSIGAGRFETDGINARKPAPEYSGGPVHDEPDADGYRNDAASGSIGHRFSGGAEIDLHVLHIRGRSDYDGSYVNETDFAQSATGVNARFSPLASWNVRLHAGRSSDKTSNGWNGVDVSTFNTRRRLQSWQNDLVFGRRQLLTLGVDRQRDLVDSSEAFDKTSRRNTAHFVQHQAGFGQHDLIAGLRRDDNESFGRNTTGNASWGYAVLDEHLRVVVSYGTAFKAPTFNDLYYPAWSNPDLQAEKSESTELALRGRESWGAWTVRGYRTDVDNLIVLTEPTYVPANVARARIDGIESEFSARTGLADVSLAASWVDPRDRDSGKLLRRRAQRSLKLQADRRFGPVQTGLEWLVQSRRFEDADNETALGGYALVNLRAQYDIAGGWFLRVRADNVFDKEYETAQHYNSLGRRYFASLGYQVH